jgi:hypothetical protein
MKGSNNVYRVQYSADEWCCLEENSNGIVKVLFQTGGTVKHADRLI